MMNRKIVLSIFTIGLPLFAWAKEGFFENRNILSLEDLNQEGQALPNRSLHWQCFDKQYLKYSCRYVKPLDGQESSLAIDIEIKSVSHLYSPSHAISGEICKELLSALNKMLFKRRQFCIQGTLDDVKVSDTKKEYFWSFYRLKTTSGYVHYRLPE